MINAKAWDWKKVKEPTWDEPADEVYALAHRWALKGKIRLLDLGCGIGRHALFFAERGFKVCAYDLSEVGLTHLQEEAKQRKLKIEARVGDMLSLPYQAGDFDCVLAYHVIYHSDRKGVETVLSEIQRILTPKGELYVTFNSLMNPTSSDPANKRIEKCTVLKTKGQEANIPHYYVDEKEIRRLLNHFTILKFSHVENIRTRNKRDWHYFVLAEKK